MGADDRAAGEKPQFHQSSGDIFGEIEAVEDTFFTGPEIGQSGTASRTPRAAIVAIQLQHNPSMEPVGDGVN